MNGLRSWRQALALVFAAARTSLLVMIGLFILNGVALGLSLEMLRRLVNELIEGSSTRSDLMPLVAGTAVLLGVAQVASSVGSQVRYVVSERVTHRTTRHFLDTAASAPYEDFLDPDFHDRFALARRGASGSAWNVVYGVVQLLSSIPPLIAIAVVIARIDPLLAVILAAAEAPSLMANARSSRMTRALSSDLVGDHREREALFLILTGKTQAAELKTHRLADAIGERHDDLASHRLDKILALSRKRGGVLLAGSLASAIGLGIALFYVIDQSIDGALSVGDAGIAVIALQQLAGRLRNIGQGLGVLSEQSFFVEYLFAPPMGPAAQSGPTRPFWGVTLDAITYRYPNAAGEALRSIDLVIEPGEVIAIVGPNGAGKSTTFALLQGLLIPSEGSLSWKATAPPDLAAVLQEPIRFELSVADVLHLGRPDDPLDRGVAQWALSSVGLDQLLDLDDRLGASFPNGRDLSGGQWQRLAVARALYRRADFLLLDEPGAHLDPDAELALFTQLRQQVDNDGTTVVVSTHRASTLRFADRVVLIDNGRVICEATGEQALCAGPIATLFASQLL